MGVLGWMKRSSQTPEAALRLSRLYLRRTRHFAREKMPTLDLSSPFIFPPVYEAIGTPSPASLLLQTSHPGQLPGSVCVEKLRVTQPQPAAAGARRHGRGRGRAALLKPATTSLSSGDGDGTGNLMPGRPGLMVFCSQPCQKA